MKEVLVYTVLVVTEARDRVIRGVKIGGQDRGVAGPAPPARNSGVRQSDNQTRTSVLPSAKLVGRG